MSDIRLRERDPYLLAYLCVAGVVVGLLVTQTLNQQWGSDFWAHLATVRAFAERPLHPLQPFTGVDVGDPLLSPFMFMLGLVTRWSGADPITVLAVAGVFNLVLWLYALRRLVVVLTSSRGAPVWVLLMTLLAWGIDPWAWSGYFNLTSIGFGLPYPSVCASALAMLALASEHEWITSGDRRQLVLVAVLVPAVLLTHPFTFVWAGIAGAAIVASLARRDRTRRILILAGVGIGGVALSLLWPFYSLIQLAMIGRQFDPVHYPLYGQLIGRSFLALPGLAVLAIRAWRNPRDPLVLTFAGTTAVFAVGGLAQHYSLGRVFPGMMLAAHIALGDAIASALASPSATRHRRVVAAAVGMLLLGGFLSSGRGLLRMVPQSLLPDSVASAGIIDPYRSLFEILKSGGVVVSSPSLNLVVGGISGRVLVPPTPSSIDDISRRRSDQVQILDPSTEPWDRRRLLERDRIQFLVVTPSEAESLRPSLGRSATVVASTGDYVVFEVSMPLTVPVRGRAPLIRLRGSTMT